MTHIVEGTGLGKAAGEEAGPAGNADAIARAFVAARRAGTALPAFPGAMPATLAAAYAVQDAALALAAGQVAGWKVGKIDPAVEGANRLTGPIFADQVVATGLAPVGRSVPAMPVFADGFAAAEAEFLLRLGMDPDPSKTDYTIAEARDMIDAVHVGIEIASSPFPGINGNGPAVTIADFGNNNGLVVGAPVAGWQAIDLDDWPVAVVINGRDIAQATTATMLDGPFGAARFLLCHMARRGIRLAAGQWISSGAVTGVHRVAPGDHVVARFGGSMTVECRIAAR